MSGREALERAREIIRQLKDRADKVVDDYHAGNADSLDMAKAARRSGAGREMTEAIDELLDNHLTQGESLDDFIQPDSYATGE